MAPLFTSALFQNVSSSKYTDRIWLKRSTTLTTSTTNIYNSELLKYEPLYDLRLLCSTLITMPKYSWQFYTVMLIYVKLTLIILRESLAYQLTMCFMIPFKHEIVSTARQHKRTKRPSGKLRFYERHILQTLSLLLYFCYIIINFFPLYC
jgi:hypothetical protein